MTKKLGAMPLVTQVPLGQGKGFTGLVDLLSMDVLLWEAGSDGVEFQRVPLLKPHTETGVKDFGTIPSLLGPSWKFGDVPVSRETMEDVLNRRSLLAEQVRIS